MIGLHCRRMVAILPAFASSTFPVIVFLSGTPCRQLNALWDDLWAISLIDEQMYVIACCHVIENDHPIPLPGLPIPVEPPLAILTELESRKFCIPRDPQAAMSNSVSRPLSRISCKVRETGTFRCMEAKNSARMAFCTTASEGISEE